MTRIEKDEAREHRIHVEITVDANGAEEQAWVGIITWVTSWHFHLEPSV